MWKYIKKWFTSKAKKIDLENEMVPTNLSFYEQAQINSLKPKIELSAMLVDRNKWSLISIILTITTLLCSIGWYQANERFAKHVRVAFVKVYPSGEHDISLYDENSHPTYFMNNVTSLLTHYVERRFSQVATSIRSDYGFVTNFMSPSLMTDFLSHFHAAKVAFDFENCTTCQQSKVTVRNIRHDEEAEAILQGQPGTIYRSTVFVVVTSDSFDGHRLGAVNQIISLVWRLKDVATLPDNLNAIRANPMGIEILSESIKTDPTPVAE